MPQQTTVGIPFRVVSEGGTWKEGREGVSERGRDKGGNEEVSE